MSRFMHFALCASLVFTVGCPDDDNLGGLKFDSGPPPDAGPAPNDLPINVGDLFTYQGISRTPNGCVNGFIDAQCEEQGNWYLSLEVTDKVPDKASNITMGSSCGAGQTLVQPLEDRCATCPGDDIATLLNGAPDIEGVPGPPQVYCIPARGWDNVYNLRALSEYNITHPHPAPRNLGNSWFFNLAPWDDSQAPADWDKATYQLFNNGQPDVVFLAYKGGEPLTLGERAGTFEIKDPSEIPYSESYDEALAAQESAVVEQRVPPPRLSVRVSPKARERINVIEGYEAIEAEDVEEVNNSTVNSIIKQAFGRKSRQIVYFGGQATLRAKQKLELEEAYAARAVRKTVEELHKKLVNDAWDSQTGYKLPKWFRVGAWSRRLKKFYKK